MAALTDALRGTGWEGPVAAGVIRADGGPRVVITTADGLSCLPPGVRLPAGVIPLSDVVPTELIRDQLGNADVRAKLMSATAAAGLYTAAIVTTGDLADRAGAVQTAAMTDDLRRSGIIPAATDVPGSGAPPPLLLNPAPTPGYADIAGRRLRSLRWEGAQPPEYIVALRSWLLATAAEEGIRDGWYAALAGALWQTPKEKAG